MIIYTPIGCMCVCWIIRRCVSLVSLYSLGAMPLPLVCIITGNYLSGVPHAGQTVRICIREKRYMGVAYIYTWNCQCITNKHSGRLPHSHFFLYIFFYCCYYYYFSSLHLVVMYHFPQAIITVHFVATTMLSRPVVEITLAM